MSDLNLLERVKNVFANLSKLDKLVLQPISTSSIVIKTVVEELEEETSFVFPQTLKDFYTNQAGSVIFNWSTEPEVFGNNCKTGSLHLLSPEEIRESYDYMKWQVEEARGNQEELSYNEGLQALVNDWMHWIPVFKFPNGDAFCIDKRNCSIVFLEHDVMDGGPNVHGTRIAQNLDNLIDKWSRIGFVDIYDWTDGVNESGIDLNKPIFQKLIERLN